MSSLPPPKLSTKAERRKDAWDRRLEANNGMPPGGKEQAGIFSKLMFGWIGPLVQLAYARPLLLDNLYPIPTTSNTDVLLARFEEAWGEQLAKPEGQRSLARALLKVFRKVMIMSGILAILQQVVLLGVPLIVQQLLRWLILDGGETYVGVIWAFALFVVGFCGNGLLTNHYFLALYVLGMDSRTMLNGVTYAKSLRLSNRARQSTSTGELVTLMSNDAQRLPDFALSVHVPWSTTIFVVIAIFLLVQLLGASALAGVLLLILMIPIQGFMAAKQMGLQRAQMKQTESRVKVVNEVLQGIRIVKYYAWEVPFVERISSLRTQEVNKIKSFAFVNAYSMSIMMTTPFMMVMLTLVVYFNGGGNFSPDVVFTAVSLLLVIRFPLMMLPMAIASWIQAKVSLARMQKFFELEELHPADREWTNRGGNGKGAGSLSVSGKFVWTLAADAADATPNDVAGGGKDNDNDNGNGNDNGTANGKGGSDSKGGVGGSSSDNSLTAKAKAKAKAAAVGPSSSVHKTGKASTDHLVEIDLKPALAAENGGEKVSKAVEAAEVWDLVIDDVEIPAGKIVAVVGQVGSGKSSLVSALLGEMTKVEGKVSIDGSVAYVAQTAWIINTSLKENILMGKPLDEKRYQKVLQVCDMGQDLSQLPAGDMTEIGEKGINLSGGQKQRVSIARAAYADADVYIMDDPLSAVDAHVARHLFDECFTGFLKGKSIILCANQLQFLPHTDLVLVLHAGRVVEKGKYADLLMEEESGLARLMEAFAEGGSDNDDGNEESKAETERGAANIRFGGVEQVGSPSAKPRSTSWATNGRSRSNSNTSRTDRTSSFAQNVASLSENAWERTVREASDTATSMVDGYAGGSSVPYASVTQSDAELLESLHHSSREVDNGGGRYVGGDAGTYASYKRRRNRSGSNRSAADSPANCRTMRVSNPSRQSSDGGGSAGGYGETRSASAVAQEALTAGGTLQTVEGKEEGAVALRVFRIYFKDGAGGWFLPITLIIVSILTQVCTNAFDYWLSYWSDQYLDDGAASWYQYVYAALCVALVALYLARALLFALQAVKSSRHLHAVLCRGVMRAPVSFFDTTPIGRVLNRFTKDMDSIDLLLPRNVPQFVATLSVLIGAMITIVVVLPWFFVVIVPVLVCYYRVQLYYRPVNRDLQRLESVSRSPIFAQFSETLNGVPTLRAYNQQEEFIDRNSARLDDSSRAFYHMHVSNRWLGIRLEAMGTSMNLAAALFVVFSKASGGLSIQGGVAGLVLTYTQQITGYLTWTVRMGCETEARITAVERAQEYADLTPEAPAVVDDYRPPEGWPATGAVKLEGIQMRYRPGLDMVLKGVTLDVKGGERIGIAGRTGSGKSSLMVTLFRIVEPCGGRLTIDGVDALRLGLRDLREAISIIPQDPVMFCGTIRENLDPFGLADDVTIWAALQAARLSAHVAGLEGKLEAEVSEGGENLSLGQRQLICLARAVLRRNKILVMDEATANVDVDTDALIQEAIRQEFSGCTVLTIAHRLNTIMDSDRILVMQDGKVGEFDTPANLVANQRSLLMGFIRQTGAGSSRRLVGIANAALGSSVTDTTRSSASASPLSSPGVGSGDGDGSDRGGGGGGGRRGGGERGTEEPTTGAAAAAVQAVAAAVVVAASNGDGDVPPSVADAGTSEAVAAPPAARGPRAEVEAVEVTDLATNGEGAGLGGGAGGGGASYLGASPRLAE